MILMHLMDRLVTSKVHPDPVRSSLDTGGIEILLTIASPPKTCFPTSERATWRTPISHPNVFFSTSLPNARARIWWPKQMPNILIRGEIVGSVDV